MQVRTTSVSDLDEIDVPGGNVVKVFSSLSHPSRDVREIYISDVHSNTVKAWKCHLRRECHLIVLTGRVGFVTLEHDCFQSVILESEKPQVLTLNKGVWFGFKGLSASSSKILNYMFSPFSDLEYEKRPLEYFDYDWSAL